jgi:hypothetical protein
MGFHALTKNLLFSFDKIANVKTTKGGERVLQIDLDTKEMKN